MTEETNVYAAPEAELSNPDARTGFFYVVSPRKFTLLFFLTMSVYLLFWFYEHWRRYKVQTGGTQWPVPRALFNIFFTHSLYNRIDERLKIQELAFNWSPSVLATLYVIFQVVTNITDQLSSRFIGSPLTDIAAILLLPVIYFCVLPAQKAANLAEHDAGGESNDNLTGLNWLWMILGGLLWIVVAIGLFAIFMGVA